MPKAAVSLRVQKGRWRAVNIVLESTWDFGSFEVVPKVHYLGRPSGYAVYDELCGFHSLDDTERQFLLRYKREAPPDPLVLQSHGKFCKERQKKQNAHIRKQALEMGLICIWNDA